MPFMRVHVVNVMNPGLGDNIIIREAQGTDADAIAANIAAGSANRGQSLKRDVACKYIESWSFHHRLAAT